MPTVSINYLAVLIAVVANMLIGYVYYAKPVFGKTWQALIGKSDEELKKGAGPAMVWMLVLAIVEAYVVAHIVDYTNATSLWLGAQTGFWLWLGLVVPTIGSENIFAGRSKKLLGLVLGYHFIALIVMGMILAMWQ